MIAYLSNLIGGFSHFLNALTGGRAENSLSARCGAAAHAGKGWAKVACAVIDALLFSRNHCLERAREEGLI